MNSGHEAATRLLQDMQQAALSAAMAKNVVPAFLPAPPSGRTIVVGAGKAAAAMARAVEQNWPTPLSGLVVTRYGHGVACQSVEVLEAAHPVPDDAGANATAEILHQLSGLQENDLVICLISGGGSALLTLPAPGISLQDKQTIGRSLLLSGATITEINCVRKHLSGIKGGRLAAACAPASVVTLIISDVPSDDPAVVASGPTVADPSTLHDAKVILERYAIEIAPNVRQHLENVSNETPKPADAVFDHCESHIIASGDQSLAAAATVAQEHGYAVLNLGCVEGESRDVARTQAALARTILAGQHAMKPPCVILSGGETTVTVRGNGRGGRNTEFALSLAINLESLDRIYAIACDTDGIDGTETNAGCIVTPDTLTDALEHGLDADALLRDNDSYGFFAAIDALLTSGPTRTNVSDFRALLVTAPGAGPDL